MTGPSEPQSDAELQVGGQLSVPSSSLFPFPIREALSSLRTDGAGSGPGQRAASPEAPALKLPGDNWGEVGVPFFPHPEGIEEATLLFECCLVVL